MGKVYAAEHVHMRKKLAVKVLHRELTSVPEVVARFEREAMAAANVDHPNVAAATDFGKLADGAVFLVLEYVQGKNLRDEIAAGPFPTPRALHVARQIAFALSAAHAQGIVHRDLKPENVMLIEKGIDADFVKVLDFGIAKVPIGEVSAPNSKGQVITKAGMVFGTPEYMAPEQALGQPVDGRADLYALGVILFEMITGSRPFSGDDKVSILGLQLSAPPPKMEERAPGIEVPPAVAQIVDKLLSKDVAQRFQKADDVAAAIEVVIGPPRSTQASSPGLANIVPTPPPYVGKPTFLPNDPLPRFPTEATVERAAAALPPLPPAPHLGKPTFLPHEPLPRFQTNETIARVEGAAEALKNLPAVPTVKLASPEDAAPRSDVASAPALERVKVALRSLQKRGAEGLAAAAAVVDRSRERWPAPVRDRLSRVSGQAVVFAGAALCATLVLVIVVALSGGDQKAIAEPSGSASASAAAAPLLPPGKDPTPLALEQARAGGVPAALELSKKFPESAQAQLELADAQANAKQYLEAAGAVGRALSLDGATKDDPRAARVLFQTAQMKVSQDASFALLEGPMQARGADILYDLVVAEGTKAGTKARAERWVRGPELSKVASPALGVAVAIRKSKSCKEVREHLPRVKEVGDGRSLVYLEFFERKSTHYACLTEGGLLEQAMNAVKARAGDAG
jgi:eukaryotic-like serine/threonine-protein kinase